MDVTNICFIGATLNGVSNAASFSLKCPKVKVYVTDPNVLRFKLWKSDNPSKLKLLNEIIKKCKNINLFFDENVQKCISESDFIFLIDFATLEQLQTDNINSNAFELIESVSRLIAATSCKNKIIVDKSTAAIHNTKIIKNILESNAKPGVTFQVLSNPDFLPEEDIIDELLSPKRIVIGGEEAFESKQAIEKLVSMYRNWVPLENIIITDKFSSTMSKIATNAFLGQRMSSINAVSAVCENTGARINEVANALSKDSRIGPEFLKASLGFYTKDLKTDILTLIFLCEDLNLPEVAKYWRRVIEMNEFQKKRFIRAVFRGLNNNLKDKEVAILEKTANDDSLMYLIEVLLSEGAKLHFINEKHPGLFSTLKGKYEKNIYAYSNFYEAAKGCHALFITDVTEAKDIDFTKVFKSMKKPASIFGADAGLNNNLLKNIGFKVFCIGIP